MHRKQIGAIVSPPISPLSQIQHHTGLTPCLHWLSTRHSRHQLIRLSVLRLLRRRAVVIPEAFISGLPCGDGSTTIRHGHRANARTQSTLPDTDSIYFFLPDILAMAAFLAASSSFCFFWKARSCAHPKPSSATRSPRLDMVWMTYVFVELLVLLLGCLERLGFASLSSRHVDRDV